MIYVPALISIVVFILYSLVRFAVPYLVSYFIVWLVSLVFTIPVYEITSVLAVIFIVYAGVRLLYEIGQTIHVVIRAKKDNIDFNRATTRIKKDKNKKRNNLKK